MARFSLVPREGKFFEDFAATAEQLRVGARLLDDMIAKDPPVWSMADEIKEIEHTCDQLTHGLLRRLNQTFVTPLDREDIHTLARSLDDVMDAIDAAAGFVRLYKIEHVRYGARELSAIILQSTEELVRGLGRLGKHDHVMDSVVEVNRLENEADRLLTTAIGRLFDEETDPILIMKWREILDFLEQATDRCEDVANVLESIVVKYA